METTENQVNYSEADVQPSPVQNAVQTNDPGQQIVPPVPTSVPQTEAQATKYAGFWIRFAANFLDGIIVGLLSLIPVFLIGLVLKGVLGLDGVANIVTKIVGYVISFGYFIFLTYKKEATWGKMAVGVKVISSNKEELGLGQVVLRETIGKIVSGLILGIGYIMAGFTERKEALHDKIAKTNVIYVDPNKKNKVWIIVVVLIFVLTIVAGILAAITLTSLNSAKQKAKKASFRASVSSIIPDMMFACDEREITASDLGTSNYFDPNSAIKTLVQDCGPSGSGSFSITINGINEMSPYSVVCTESTGCVIKEE